MPAATSSARARAKAALFKALAADVRLRPSGTVSIVVAYDQPSDLADQYVWVGLVVRTVSKHQMIGSGLTGSMLEHFSIEVTIEVYVGGAGESAQTAYERAVALCDIAEDVVRQDPSLAGTVLSAFPVDSDDVPGFAADKGRATTISMQVACTAQI